MKEVKFCKYLIEHPFKFSINIALYPSFRVSISLIFYKFLKFISTANEKKEKLFIDSKKKNHSFVLFSYCEQRAHSCFEQNKFSFEFWHKFKKRNL